jgi:hypothetical protein
MALPNVARAIVVGGQRFRWLVSDRDAPARLVAVVQRADGRGRRLLADVGYERVWRSSAPTGAPRQGSVVSPSLVRAIILRGLERGWRPGEPGRDVEFDIYSDYLRGGPLPVFENGPAPLTIRVDGWRHVLEGLDLAAFREVADFEVRCVESPAKGWQIYSFHSRTLGPLAGLTWRPDLEAWLASGAGGPEGTPLRPYHEIEYGELLLWRVDPWVYVATGRVPCVDRRRDLSATVWFKVGVERYRAAWRALADGFRAARARRCPTDARVSRDRRE